MEGRLSRLLMASKNTQNGAHNQAFSGRNRRQEILPCSVSDLAAHKGRASEDRPIRQRVLDAIEVSSPLLFPRLRFDNACQIAYFCYRGLFSLPLGRRCGRQAWLVRGFAVRDMPAEREPHSPDYPF